MLWLTHLQILRFYQLTRKRKDATLTPKHKIAQKNHPLKDLQFILHIIKSVSDWCLTLYSNVYIISAWRKWLTYPASTNSSVLSQPLLLGWKSLWDFPKKIVELCSYCTAFLTKQQLPRINTCGYRKILGRNTQLNHSHLLLNDHTWNTSEVIIPKTITHFYRQKHFMRSQLFIQLFIKLQ